MGGSKNFFLFIVFVFSLNGINAKAEHSPQVKGEKSEHGRYIVGEPQKSSPSATLVIPESIKKHEIMLEMYKDFANNSNVPNEKSLAPGDEQGYKCHIFSTETGKMSEFQMFFITVKTANGRFIRLRLESPGQDKKTNFLLTKTLNGWRGVADEPYKTQAVRPIHVLSGTLATDTADSMITGHYNDYLISNVKFSPNVKSFETRVFETLSVKGNANNPDELFLELGDKTDALFLDDENKPIHSNTKFSVKYYYNQKGFPSNGTDKTLEFNTEEQGKTRLKMTNGSHSEVKSLSFQDRISDLERYSMKSLGACVKIADSK